MNVASLLCDELGKNQVLTKDHPYLAPYSRDESGLGDFHPDCVALCESAEQVSIVLRLAQEHNIPVTPRGAGTGMTGGCLPVYGGIVLSTERMNKIIDIDTKNSIAIVQSGTIVSTIQDVAEEQGLFYPPDPASLKTCSIGGNIASNAGGPRAFKYGVTREYVLGLHVGLMGGELLRCGKQTTKGVTGYDLTAGFVGSEGTFGVVTEATIKLLPLPQSTALLLALFQNETSCSNAIDQLLHQGFHPRAIELMDRNTLMHMTSSDIDLSSHWAVLIELDGEPNTLETITIHIGELLEKNNAIDIIVARDERDRRRLWSIRRACSKSLRNAHQYKISEDICVPRGSIGELFKRIDSIPTPSDLSIATFGHAGDGNLHVNILADSEEATKHIEPFVHALFEHTIALKGTLSGEHGIGLSKKQYMPLEQTPQVIAWQKKWKHMWDPNNLLNPGKIFPDDNGKTFPIASRRCPE